MRWLFVLVLWCLTLGSVAEAAEGRVIKVLPQFLNLRGRETISPSLFDRDAYQVFLRTHPAERSGMRFAVQWKAKVPETEPLKLRVELRGLAHGDVPKETSIEQIVHQRRWFSHWADVNFSGDVYRDFGEVTAWRVTLWDGDQLLSEQKSFLWQ
ncbi:MAG: hypothetical protein JWR19_4527 [Pedosphaera sp.]|nr:hypothetical protein [Pedosphaera sp.]